MGNDTGALERLKAALRSRTAACWLEGARVVRTPDGRTVLQVAGPFRKRRLEETCLDTIRSVLDGPVEIVAGGAAGAAPPPRRAAPRLHGASGELTVRLLRAFVRGEPPSAPLVVVHGPPRSGKSVLLEWAASLGAGGVFRLDVARVRSGRSRGLVPRMPLVVADGLEVLAGRATAQRTLCTILDAVLDRGNRVLCSIEGHPARARGLEPTLRSRLLGGFLLAVEAAGGTTARPEAGVPAPRAPDAVLARMKDVAARLFEVDRTLLDGGTKRRSVVAARRTVIAAAARQGIASARIAAAFGLRSDRAVRAACQWARSEERRDRDFATLLHEVGRVLPGP